MELWERVRQLIEDKHLSQADVSRSTGIDRSYLNRLLSGKARWNKDHLDAVARCLDTTASELLADDREPQAVPITDLFNVEILRQAHEAVEKFSRTIPIKIINSRQTCIIQRLYEHYLIYQEAPTPELAKKYFFSC